MKWNCFMPHDGVVHGVWRHITDCLLYTTFTLALSSRSLARQGCDTDGAILVTVVMDELE